MKNKIIALLAAMLTISAMPVSAVYQSQDEIAFALRGMETTDGGYLAQGNTVYISPLAAKEGTKFHMGMFIEADYADFVFLDAKFKSENAGVTFNQESFHNPARYYTDEKVTYTMADGTEFSTRLRPYCLGLLNSNMVYQPNAFGIIEKFIAEENAFSIQWQYGYTDQTSRSVSFFGETSDEYSFIEMDVDIAAGLAKGSYGISFIEEENGKKTTNLTSDDSVDPENIDYNDFTPAMKNLEIVIAEGGDANLDGKTDAEDAAAILVYSAAKGAGGSPTLCSTDAEQERLAYFLADVNEYSTVCGEGDGTTLDAMDASAILQYAAIGGTGAAPDWSEIVGK